MEAVEISPEVYEAVKEQVRAEVIEEYKEQKRREAKKREERRMAKMIAIDNLFKPTRSKYFVKVVTYLNMLSRAGQRFDTVQMVDQIFSETERLALKAIGEWSKESAYRHDKADEANKMAEEILENRINRK